MENAEYGLYPRKIKECKKNKWLLHKQGQQGHSINLITNLLAH